MADGVSPLPPTLVRLVGSYVLNPADEFVLAVMADLDAAWLVRLFGQECLRGVATSQIDPTPVLQQPRVRSDGATVYCFALIPATHTPSGTWDNGRITETFVYKVDNSFNALATRAAKQDRLELFQALDAADVFVPDVVLSGIIAYGGERVKLWGEMARCGNKYTVHVPMDVDVPLGMPSGASQWRGDPDKQLVPWRPV